MDEDTDTDPPFRGEIRLTTQRRVSHGLGVCEETRSQRRGGVDGATCAAYLLVLPPRRGLHPPHRGPSCSAGSCPKLPDQVPGVRRRRQATRLAPRRARADLLAAGRTRCARSSAHGLPVDRAEEILLRAARDLSLLDLLILLESALASTGHVDHDRMIAHPGRRAVLGVRMLREAWRRATGRRASPVARRCSRQFHLVMERARPSRRSTYTTPTAVLVARADLRSLGTPFVHEYDGAAPPPPEASRSVDLRRERGLAAAVVRPQGIRARRPASTIQRS